MRLSPLVYRLAIAAACFMPLTAQAQDGSFEAARHAARQALECAKLELRLYVQVEYPRERRRLDAEIKLVEAEIEIYRDREREYRPFDRFSTGGALVLAVKENKFRILEAELRLKDLQAERNALVRFHSDQLRLLELQVYQARVRVAELEHAVEQPIVGPSA